MLNIGDKAPEFKLQSQEDRNVSLGHYEGKWIVLYFYPKDDTPGCTVEACNFTFNVKKFERLDAVILGVSPDSPESHRKFIAKKNLKIPLLSDPTHEVLEQYEAWGEKSMYGKKYMGVLRSTYLIDPEGKIAFIWKNVKVDDHIEAVRVKLEELKK